MNQTSEDKFRQQLKVILDRPIPDNDAEEDALLDAILSAVKAELGAALDKLSSKHFIATNETAFNGEHRLIFLSEVEKLRNHFGIGEGDV